jgi:hypothetical protein
MNESDIKEVLQILKSALRSEDWSEVEEAKNYLQEYLDSFDEDDEEDY